MFQNKIPLKDDLLKRGVLIKLQTNCAYGCRVTEMLHIFSLNVAYSCRYATRFFTHGSG
jgi:hypothetical protein